MLHVVSETGGNARPTDYETLMAVASEQIQPNLSTHELIAHAQRIAEMTISLVRAEQNAGILASVTLLIQDAPTRVAFLELIGEQLL